MAEDGGLRFKLYRREDLRAAAAQARNRSLLCLLPLLPLLLGCALAFLARAQALTVVLFVLAGFWALFCHGVFIAPVRAYSQHIRSALEGKTRRTPGVFLGFEENRVERRGVRFIPLGLRVGKTAISQDDRLFYLDANLHLPDWKAGEPLLVDTHDKAVVGWDRPGSTEG